MIFCCLILQWFSMDRMTGNLTRVALTQSLGSRNFKHTHIHYTHTLHTHMQTHYIHTLHTHTHTTRTHTTHTTNLLWCAKGMIPDCSYHVFKKDFWCESVTMINDGIIIFSIPAIHYRIQYTLCSGIEYGSIRASVDCQMNSYSGSHISIIPNQLNN